MLKLEFAAPLALGAGFLAGHILNGAAPAAPAVDPNAPVDTTNSDPTLTGADTAGLDFSSLDSSGVGSLNGVLPGGGSGYGGSGLPGGGDSLGPPMDPGPILSPSPSQPPPPTAGPVASSSPHGARPAGAIGWLVYKGPNYTVSGGTAHQQYVSVTVGAWIGPAAHYAPNATLNRILTGGHAGSYVPAYRGTVTPT